MSTPGSAASSEAMCRSSVEISTFHKFCVRILRRYGRAVGLDSNFSIFDTSDQQQLIRHVLNELDIDTVAYNPSTMAGMISRAKNDLITAERYAEALDGFDKPCFVRILATGGAHQGNRFLRHNQSIMVVDSWLLIDCRDPEVVVGGGSNPRRELESFS